MQTFLDAKPIAEEKVIAARQRQHVNPEPIPKEKLVNPWIAILPLVVVGVLNKLFTNWIPQAYGTTYEGSLPGLDHPITIPIGGVAAIWAVQGALIAASSLCSFSRSGR